VRTPRASIAKAPETELKKRNWGGASRYLLIFAGGAEWYRYLPGEGKDLTRDKHLPTGTSFSTGGWTSLIQSPIQVLGWLSIGGQAKQHWGSPRWHEQAIFKKVL